MLKCWWFALWELGTWKRHWRGDRLRKVSVLAGGSGALRGSSEPAFSFYLGRNSANILNLEMPLHVQPVFRAMKNSKPVHVKF